MFNRVLEKVPQVLEKVWVALGQSQVRFGEGSGEALVQSQVMGGFGAFWCRAAEPGQVQQGCGAFRRRSEVFPALGSAA